MTWLRFGLLALLAAAGPGAATATESADGDPVPSPVELLPETCEMELALSAAPPHLRPDAAVYGLGPDGYRKLRDGSNGFTCLVNRDHPRVLKPTCFDREGADTVVPKILFFGQALMDGEPAAAVREKVQAGFDEGRFRS
ncbi:MAG: hypothetical protein AAGM22_29855, partial [Acidobacteriota bacterium]